MTTEQMDWLDDERAGRHAPPKQGEQPKGGAGDSGAADELDGDGFPKTSRFLDGIRNGRGRWPFTPNPDDSVKPDPMGAASLADRLRAMGAVQTRFMQRDPEHNEPTEWVNAPLEVVVEQAKRAASVFSDDLHDWAATPSNGIRAWGMSGIPEIMFGDPSDEQLAAAQERSGRNGVLIIPEKMRDYLYGNRIADAEEHTHHTREARDQCAAGDHKYAVLLDDAAEREKLKATIDAKQGEASMIAAGGWCYPSGQVYDFLPTDEEIKMAKRERRKAKKARRRAKKTVTVSAEDYVTMAEEPIEVRLRRAWLNGFKDGVDRASYAATESTGRWDY